MDGGPSLTPDLVEMRRHIDALMVPYESGRFEIVGFPASRGGAITPRHFNWNEPDAMVQHALALNKRDGVGVYVGAGRRNDRAPAHGRAAFREGHIADTFWLWLDFDESGTYSAALEQFEAAQLPPTIRVVTGTIPFKRGQLWFRLRQEVSGDQARQLMDGLIKATDADSSPKNPCRVMRLAGSLNWPKKHKGGRVLEPVTIEHLDAETEGYFPIDFERIDSSETNTSEPGSDVSEAEQSQRTRDGATCHPLPDLRFGTPDKISLDEALGALRSIPNNLDRNQWVGIAAALKLEFGEAAKSAFLAWSATWIGGQSNPDEDMRVWETLTPAGDATLATLVWHARQNGWSRQTAGTRGSTTEATVSLSDQSAKSKPLTLLWFEDDAQAYVEDAWAIEGLLPLRGLGVIYGAPGSGKTFVALDLALHVASGKPTWRNLQLQSGAVIYHSLEGGRPFSNRLVAWQIHNEMTAPSFCRSPDSLNLCSTEADVARIVAAGKLVRTKTGQPVRLVVVDTLNRAMAGGNENDVADMGALIRNCDAICRALDTFVLIVHHSGKDVSKGSRGHSSLLGAVDTELSLSDSVLTVSKQRDGEDGLKFGITLETVAVGHTPKGKGVVSCVAVESEVRRDAGLKESQRQTLEAIREFAFDHGKPNPAGTGWPEPGTLKVVGLSPLIEHLAGKQSADVGSERRKQARKKVATLIERRVLQQNEEFVWIV